VLTVPFVFFLNDTQPDAYYESQKKYFLLFTIRKLIPTNDWVELQACPQPTSTNAVFEVLTGMVKKSSTFWNVTP
jgi:hypothetical protein